MSDQTPAGVARITKTKRLQHSIVQADLDAGFVTLDVPWDTPFTDLNHTVSVGLEVVAPADAGNYLLYPFMRTVSKISVEFSVTAPAAVGDVVMIHAHAVRD
jgi:hypothetical protein